MKKRRPEPDKMEDDTNVSLPTVKCYNEIDYTSYNPRQVMKKISRDRPSQDSPHPGSSSFQFSTGLLTEENFRFCVGSNAVANRSNKVEEAKVKFKLVPLEDKVLLEVLGGLAEGVKDLHLQGLVHQLICMDNIFMRKMKVILGQPLLSSINRNQGNRQIRQIGRKHFLTPPEILQGYTYSCESDVWALGIVFLEIMQANLLKNQPLSTLNQMEKNEKKFPEYSSEQFKRLRRRLRVLVGWMLQEDKSKRAKINQVIEFIENLQQPSYQRYRLLNLFENNHASIQNTRDNSFNHFRLEQIKVPLSGKIRIFKCQNSDMQLYTFLCLRIEIGLSSIKVILTNSQICQATQSTIPNVWTLLKILKEQKGHLAVTQAGFVDILVPEDKLSELRDENRPEKLKRIERCLAIASNEKKKYDGLIIGYGLLLTSSRAVFNPRTKEQATRLFISSKLGSSMQPVQTLGILINQDLPEKPYIVLQMQKEVSRKRYITLVKDYNQQQTMRKLGALQFGTTFYYQLGDQLVLLPGEIDLSKKGIFSIDKKVKVNVGCPLFVVFGHNLCFAIGMVKRYQKSTQTTRGYLFQEEFYWEVWKWVDEHMRQNSNLPNNLTSRMVDWSVVDLAYAEPPYQLNQLQLFTSYEYEQDYYLSDRNSSYYNGLHNQISVLMTQMVMEMGTERSLSNGNFQKLIELYTKMYGPVCESMAIQYFNRGFSMYQIGGRSRQQLIDCFETTIAIEEKHPRNILLYMMALVQATISIQGPLSMRALSSDDREKSLHYLEKCQEISRKLRPSLTTIQMYQCFGLHYNTEGNMLKVEEYLSKNLEAARDIPEISGQFVQMFQQTLKNNVGLGHYSRAIATLKVGFETSKKKRDKDLRRVVQLEWERMKNQLILNKADEEVVNQFLKLTLEELPQQVKGVQKEIAETRRNPYLRDMNSNQFTMRG